MPRTFSFAWRVLATLRAFALVAGCGSLVGCDGLVPVRSVAKMGPTTAASPGNPARVRRLVVLAIQVDDQDRCSVAGEPIGEEALHERLAALAADPSIALTVDIASLSKKPSQAAANLVNACAKLGVRDCRVAAQAVVPASGVEVFVTILGDDKYQVDDRELSFAQWQEHLNGLKGEPVGVRLRLTPTTTERAVMMAIRACAQAGIRDFRVATSANDSAAKSVRNEIETHSVQAPSNPPESGR